MKKNVIVALCLCGIFLLAMVIGLSTQRYELISDGHASVCVDVNPFSVKAGKYKSATLSIYVDGEPLYEEPCVIAAGENSLQITTLIKETEYSYDFKYKKWYRTA